MSVSSNINKYQYTGNSSSVEFAFPQKILSTDDLSVYLYQISTGVQTTLIETTNYTVAIDPGGLENGATITTLVTYSSDYTITIIRDNALTQSLDLVSGGTIPSDPLETAIDNCVMITQQLDEKISDRVLFFPESEPSSTSTILPSIGDRANRFLGFDENGEPATFSTLDGSLNINNLKIETLSAVDTVTEIDATSDPIAVAVPTETDHALNQDAADLLYSGIIETNLRTTETALTAWSGSVTPALVAGTSYTVDVTANVTTFAPTLATVGTCKIVVSNATLYTIADPSNTGRYSRLATGIDDLSAKAFVELIITRTGTDYVYSAVELIAIT